ncbi:chorismate-binding protein [uncultured Fibrella sp.]|uniref:chorismate-binding protein n=1 Tax=uncultured Fibrella sp. TaxID=1284596 RepID=UPI0035CAA5DF
MTASSAGSNTTVHLDVTLNHLWQTARTNDHPAALWRLPNQSEKHLIVHLGEVLSEQQPIDLDERPPGFAIGLFDAPADDFARAFYLHADRHVVLSADGQLLYRPTVDTTATRAFDEATYLTAQQRTDLLTGISFTEQPDPDAQAAFEEMVAQAVAAMQAGRFWKVVLSRTKTIQFSNVPDVVTLFDRLCAAYPTAFISAVWLPEGTGGRPAQVWLSATPERLASMDANGIFRTVALAGTQSAYTPEGTLKRTADALWSQKEIEEQALVSRYIIGCFKRIRLREYVEEGPKTAQAGNLMHLCSQYSVDTKAVNFPQLGTVMLRLLHPTSAVCGMPRPEALDFIQTHEQHDRGFYAGFVGPVNIDGASQLFVHIRCLSLDGKIATLYAGAGLTEDSDPQKEWLETEMKCQTLLRGMRT